MFRLGTRGSLQYLFTAWAGDSSGGIEEKSSRIVLQGRRYAPFIMS